MPYQARVINVMIASPGDVAAERSAIQAIIHRWNSVNAEDHRTVLMPIMWETHSTPEMGDRPQAIINRQLLERCDLLVAAFWTRLGTPTGAAASGTVEEIHKHVDSGKPAMVYFSNKPVALDSVDIDQYKALKEFRDDCKKKGLISTYDSLEQFSDEFSRHLSQIVRDQFTGNGEPDEASAPTLRPPRPKISETAGLMLVAAADGGGEVLRIPMMDGTMIRAGAQQPENNDRRVLARWEAATRELVNVGYIEPRGHKGEMFSVTHAGYEAADALRTEAESGV
jgi:hypothetical protein